MTTMWERWPRRVLAGAIAVAVLGCAMAAFVYPRLTAALSDYDDPSSDSAAAQQQLIDATGSNPEEGYILLVRSPSRIDPSAPPPAVVARATGVLKQRPEVVDVIDYASARNPLMVSRDGLQTYVLGAVGHADGRKTVAALRAAIDRDPLLRGNAQLSGPTVSNVDIAKISTEDLFRAEMIAVPLLLVGLLLVYRGVIAAVIPLVGAGFAIMVAFIGLAVAMTFVSVSIFAMNLMTALGMGLAVDFSLLVVTRYREEVDRGETTVAAVRRTLRTAGRAVLFSSATIACSMLALLMFPQRFLYSMGLAGALVALGAALYALVVLPAVLLVLGPRIDAWSPKRWRRRRRPHEHGRWYRIARTVMRRPVLYAATAAAVLIVVGLPFLHVRFTGYDARILPTSTETARVPAILDAQFEHAMTSPTVITVDGSADPSAVTEYAQRVRAVDGVSLVLPPRQIGADLWRIDVEPSAKALSPAARQTVERIQRVPSPGRTQFSGETARFMSLLTSLANRLPWVIAVVLVLSAILLFLMTGSMVLPLKNIVMNLLSLSATFGILVMVFQWGWIGESLGSIEVTSLVLVGILATGLSTDYSVFLLSRIKAEYDRGADNREAVALGVDRTGPVVTAAAALMFIPLIAMTTSHLAPVRELGLSAASAVLIDATIVRAILVPSLMALLGKWNWAAPGPLRSAHRWFESCMGEVEPVEADARTGRAADASVAGPDAASEPSGAGLGGPAASRTVVGRKS